MKDAFLFALPIYEFARTRDAALRAALAAGRPAINHLTHRTTLSNANNRGVTTPNNDTLYSSAWIDLSHAPVTISLPAASDRYLSVALMDIFTDHIAVLRPTKMDRTITLVGPRHKAPVTEFVRSKGNHVWMLVRIGVDGPADLDAARRAQQMVRLDGPVADPDLPEQPIAIKPGNGETFLTIVNKLVASDGGSAEDRAAQFASVGLGAQGSRAQDVRALWNATLDASYLSLAGGLAKMGISRNGWAYPPDNIGRFGKDNANRARVAIGGLGALPADEALYITAVADSEGNPLIGSRSYRLTIPADVPMESEGFWSLTMYELMPDGRQFVVANTLNRYSIGDRTPDLVRNADGSVTITLQETSPATSSVNWLPAPEGRFSVTFRVYLPRKHAFKPGFMPAIRAEQNDEEPGHKSRDVSHTSVENAATGAARVRHAI